MNQRRRKKTPRIARRFIVGASQRSTTTYFETERRNIRSIFSFVASQQRLAGLSGREGLVGRALRTARRLVGGLRRAVGGIGGALAPPPDRDCSLLTCA